jgi:hypothetical protein
LRRPSLPALIAHSSFVLSQQELGKLLISFSTGISKEIVEVLFRYFPAGAAALRGFELWPPASFSIINCLCGWFDLSRRLRASHSVAADG